MDTAIVLGVGPDQGLGAQLCYRFADQGLHVIAAGRSEDKLAAVVEFIEKNGGKATAVVSDATEETDCRALFQNLPGPLKLAIYNAGNNTPGKIRDMSATYFEDSWKVCCFGAFLFGRAAVNAMPQGGTILFTGASASLRGRANFGAFNSAKGALRNFAQALAKEVGPDGIHVGHVVIDGPICGDKIKHGFPDYAERLGSEGMISLDGIVDGFEYLHNQRPTAWSFEVDVRTSIERW
ncbi:MAG: SDR family NAD(P)-dependent oxidoreductase [Pseudomonadaceae bacterium]|nr:SDR family NAD(P)-dependent oxidoreductase [Pseudomonadaceae bacterium]